MGKIISLNSIKKNKHCVKRGKARLLLFGIPLVVSFVVLSIATMFFQPPIPTICAVVFIALAILFIVMTFNVDPSLSFILPAVATYLLFMIIPTFNAFKMSLFSIGTFGLEGDYIGLENYKRLVFDDEFSIAFVNGLELFAAIFVLTNVISLVLAGFLDIGLRGTRAYRAIFFMPVIISPIASGFIWRIVFGGELGILNPALEVIGLGAWQQDWMGSAPWVMYAIICVEFWRWNGMPVVLYLANLQSIPQELKDAAVVDGASNLQVFAKVVFPLLASAFTIVTGLSFLNTMRAFEIPFTIAGRRGGPYMTAEFMTTLVMRKAFPTEAYDPLSEIGYAVSVAVLMFITLLVMVSILLFFLRRREVEL